MVNVTIGVGFAHCDEPHDARLKHHFALVSDGELMMRCDFLGLDVPGFALNLSRAIEGDSRLSSFGVYGRLNACDTDSNDGMPACFSNENLFLAREMVPVFSSRAIWLAIARQLQDVLDEYFCDEMGA